MVDWNKPVNNLSQALDLIHGNKAVSLQFKHRLDPFSNGQTSESFSRSLPDKIPQPFIKDEGVIEIVQGLKKNTSMKALDLSGNRISSSGVSALGEYLEGSDKLEVLYLDDNELCDSDMVVLGHMLKKNKGLKQLSLSGNRITSKGAKALASGLKKNQNLEKLWLNRNEIRNGGAIALGKALKKENQMSLLALENNRVREKGAKKLAKTYRKNEGLAELNLGGNKIGRKGAKYFNKTLKKMDSNDSPRKLILDGNRFNEEDLDLLRSKGSAKGVTVEVRLGYAAKPKEKLKTRIRNYVRYHSGKQHARFDDEKPIKRVL